MTSGGPLVFTESESMFASAVIEGNHVIKSGGIKRYSRTAARDGKGTVMEDSICVRILVAWHRWSIVAF